MDEQRQCADEEQPSRAERYAYMRSDGTLAIVGGGLVAGLGGYIFQFLGGRSLGVEGFAPIGVLLTAHFLAFVIVLLPIEQFVIRRLTLGARGWVVPARGVALAATTAVGAAFVVSVAGDAYFAELETRTALTMFVVASVIMHFFFAVGRGYLAGTRRFRAYGFASAGASMFRLAIAVAVVIVAPSVIGFAWAHVLGPLVIILWRPWRQPRNEPEEVASAEPVGAQESGLLGGLVLAAAASQALLLAGPLVASRLGATYTEFSIVYATLLIARAPLTLGYNLIARILPSFTQMAVRDERQELRSWARGIAAASLVLAGVGGLLGAMLGPILVGVAFGPDFAPTPLVAGIAGAGVVLASGALFIGQILVAKGQSFRLGIAWLLALGAGGVMIALPFDDPIIHVVIAFAVAEVVALSALVAGALLKDGDESEVSHGYQAMKRSFDIAGAMVALFLLLPVILGAAIAIKRDSPGPVFFRQRRVGRDGDLFWMVKLRTMAFDDDGAVFKRHLEELRRTGAPDSEYTIKIDDDPRITNIGGTLRKWSIDEIPNLWNVLRGSMSLVGPRPLVREEAEIIGIEHPRFEVKPGVTGLAQIHGRDSIAFEARTEWDKRYVETRTTKLDLEILFATVGAVITTPGERDTGE